MEMIDGKWLAARLSGEHGEKARLAAAMGISRDKLSKVLNGRREIQLAEIPRVLQFFGVEFPEGQAGRAQGMSEPAIQPFNAAPQQRTALLSGLTPGRRGVELYKAPRDYTVFGILKGDILLVHLGATPAHGDIVVATIHDFKNQTDTTVLRRASDPWLISDQLAQPPIEMDPDDGSIGILGAVLSVAREKAVPTPGL